MDLVTTRDDCLLIRPQIDLVGAAAEDFKALLKGRLDLGPRQIIVDLAGVQRMDAAAISALIAAARELDPAGGRLRLRNVSAGMRRLLAVMRLDGYIEGPGRVGV